MGKQLDKNEAQEPAGECVGRVEELFPSWQEVESASCLLSRARIVVNRRWVLALDTGLPRLAFDAACH